MLIKSNENVVSIFKSYESGQDIQALLKNTKLTEDAFNSVVLEYKSSEQLEAALLHHFFTQVNQYFIECGHTIVNTEIINGRVFNNRTCESWVTTSSGKTKSQLFGTYIDIGIKDFFLHICVGTVNLHVGFVKYEKLRNDRYFLHEVSSLEEAKFKYLYNEEIKDGLQLQKRNWGSRWISFDCGRFFNFSIDEHFSIANDLKSSVFFRDYLEPCLELFKRRRDESKIWVFESFDKRQLWRFFVDGRFHKKYRGWVGYEANEHNSTRGMINGFNYIFTHFDEGEFLTQEYIINLHYACMHAVRPNNQKSTPGIYRYLPAGFHFYGKNSTINSLEEILKLRSGDNSEVFFSADFRKDAQDIDLLKLYERLNSEEKLRYKPWYPALAEGEEELLRSGEESERFLELQKSVREQFAEKLQEILDNYNSEIKEARNSFEKLHAICKVVRDGELLHPFPDGNGRAFPVLLMNHLLMYHGFVPVILKDPNIDAELSYSEFVVEVVKSMEYTLQLLNDPESHLFKFSIKDLTQKENDEFLHMSTLLIESIESFGKPTKKEKSDIFVSTSVLETFTNKKWENLHKETYFKHVGYYNTFRKDSVYFAMAIKDWEKEGKSVVDELNRVTKKAKAIVIDNEAYAKQLNIPVLLVDDIEKAFHDTVEKTRQEVNPTTVLITGTEGKTGSKIQLHHLLKNHVNTHAVLNSANTEGPIFLSLANLKAEDKIEINEVSVSSNLEVNAQRAKVVNPHLCFFTNIGPNHMDMHKSIENIINAKSSVVEGLIPNGLAIINNKNEYGKDLAIAIQKRRSDVEILTYGDYKKDDAQLLEATFINNPIGWKVKARILDETIEYHVPLIQNHAPLMSVGLLLVVKKLGFDVQTMANEYKGLNTFETMGRVFQLNNDGKQALFYDQSRRGAIEGIRSAFDDLKNFKVEGKVIALLGGVSIKQDNDWTKEAHKELASLVNKSEISRLYTTGKFMSYVHEDLNNDVFVKHSDDLEFLADTLVSELEESDLLFIIGSAYLYLGRVSDMILKKVKFKKLI